MLGSTSGILNLVVFVFLITFLGAIFAVQIFRGDIPQMGTDGKTTRVSFFTIFNSFLGMYQILSSENWTTILYNATQCLNPYGTAWIAATFLIIWFILANCKLTPPPSFRVHKESPTTHETESQSSSSTCSLRSFRRTLMSPKMRSECNRFDLFCSKRSSEHLHQGDPLNLRTHCNFPVC